MVLELNNEAIRFELEFMVETRSWFGPEIRGPKPISPGPYRPVRGYLARTYCSGPSTLTHSSHGIRRITERLPRSA